MYLYVPEAKYMKIKSKHLSTFFPQSPKNNILSYFSI